MSTFPDKRNDDNLLSDNQLDRLLSMAELPAVDHSRQRRLEQHLLGLLDQQKQPAPTFSLGWVPGIGAATACGLMVLIVLMVFLERPTTPTTRSVAMPEFSPPPIKSSPYSLDVFTHTVWVTPEQPKPISKPISSWIEKKLSALPASIKSCFESELGLDCLEQFAITLDSQQKYLPTLDGSSRQALKSAQQWRQRFEWKLKQKIAAPDTSPNRRLLAFRKLCRCGTRNSLGFLFNHWKIQHLRSEIVPIACRLADPSTLVELVESTNDAELQFTLMTQLLERGDWSSVGLFLELTDRKQLFTLARRCGQRTRRLPTEQLLGSLRSNQYRTIRAAAITLSAVDSTLVSHYLLELAQHPQTAQAAVTALTARQDNLSTSFVNKAASDLRWSATVATAQKKWNRLLTIN